MACFQSVRARRILLWYILIASIIVLPLAWDVTVGCTMILAGPVDAESKTQLMGFGLFSRAVYDEADGSFLSCVKYSQDWRDKTSDTFFKVGRAFGICMAGFTTLATLICLLVQCFNKHGKTSLWTIMKWSYAFAFASQLAIFSIWATEICDNFDGESYKCTVGSNSVTAVFNLLFLLGMVIATFNSQPPRNPVFRLWNIIPTEYETDKFDTDDDQSDDLENPKHLGRILAESGSEDSDIEDNDDRMESVSLFGSRSARSARDARSTSTRGSSSQRSSRRSGKSPARTKDNSDSSSRSRKTSKTAKTEVTAKTSFASDDNSSFGKSKHSSSKESKKSGSIKTSKTAITDASTFQRSSKRSSNDSYIVAALADDDTSVEIVHNDDGSKRSEKSGSKRSETSGSKRSEPSGSKRSEPSSLTHSRNSRKEVSSTRSATTSRSKAESTRGSLKEGNSIRSSRDESSISSQPTKRSLAGSTESIISFVSRVGASATVGYGGMRISETKIGNKLEIIDEYPSMSLDGGIFPPPDADGTDIVKVRTEFCPEGSKTIKEVTHTDGSRSVTTVIDPTRIEG